MLPECRQNDYLYTIPPFIIEENNIEDFAEELRKFHGNFSDCFARRESRENFCDYMAGLLSDLERKSAEPIAVNIKGIKSVRSMQRTMSNAVWYEDKILYRYQELVLKEMGDPEGVLIFDESGFVKKGEHSAGVARQYCGGIGKVENCQNGVFAAYASPKGYTLLDKRLFIPGKWFGDDFKKRRIKCGIPEDIIFKSKPGLAVGMFLDIVRRDAVPFRYVAADSLYGNSPEFIEALESCAGKIYMVSMPSDTLFWLHPPVTREQSYQYRGEKRTKTVSVEKERQPVSFKDFAEKLHRCFWYRRTVSEGTKGPIEYEFTKRNIILSKDGLPGRNVWLIIKRTVGRNPEYSFYVSNAPVSTRLNTFVRLSGIRWSVEQCFQECKSELGMDHYEVRKFAGWHRHMLTCILSHFFLWHIRITLEDKAPLITLPQLRLLLKTVLPLKIFSGREIIDLVRWIQEKNHKAYLSHRKRKPGKHLAEDDLLTGVVMG